MIYDDNRGRDQGDVTQMLDGMFWQKKSLNFQEVVEGFSMEQAATMWDLIGQPASYFGKEYRRLLKKSWEGWYEDQD